MSQPLPSLYSVLSQRNFQIPANLPDLLPGDLCGKISTESLVVPVKHEFSGSGLPGEGWISLQNRLELYWGPEFVEAI